MLSLSPVSFSGKLVLDWPDHCDSQQLVGEGTGTAGSQDCVCPRLAPPLKLLCPHLAALPPCLIPVLKGCPGDGSAFEIAVLRLIFVSCVPTFVAHML